MSARLNPYARQLDDFLADLEFVSVGASEGCSEHSGSFGFHPYPCTAHHALGGDRYPAHGVDKDGEIVHFGICYGCYADLAGLEEGV